MQFIDAIHKPDRNSPVEAISLVKTSEGKIMPVRDVVYKIMISGEKFCVRTGQGIGWTEVRTEKSARGHWFIKTVPNGTEADNLLSLPEIFPPEYPEFPEYFAPSLVGGVHSIPEGGAF